LSAGSQGCLRILDSAFELGDVLLDCLQLFFLCDEFLRYEIEVVPALVLLHDLEHGLQVLSEATIALADSQLFLVLRDLHLDALLGQRHCSAHHFLGLFSEADAAAPEGFAEVVEGLRLGVAQLFSQEGLLVDGYLLALVLLVSAGAVDVRVGLPELSGVAQVLLSVLHDFLLDLFVVGLQVDVLLVGGVVAEQQFLSVALESGDGVLVLGYLFAVEVDCSFELLDVVVRVEVVLVDVADDVASLPGL
jgi:hypothetical protein